MGLYGGWVKVHYDKAKQEYIFSGGFIMNDKKVKKLVKISILTAFAFAIMLIDFPIPFFPPFLKMDLSDIPAILGAFSMGPLAGIMVELVKNILHAIVKPDTLGIGELANFIVGSAFVFTSGVIYLEKKNRTHALIGLGVGTVVMSAAAALGNLFIFLPLYSKFLSWPMPSNLASFLALSIVPFNLVKGILVSIITFLVYKKLSPVLHR